MVGKRGTARTYRCPESHKHNATGTCFNQHGCGCFPCVEGRRVYQLDRDKKLAYGRWDTNRAPIDATGTRRRLQALAFMGWSSSAVAAELGTRDTHVRKLWRVRTTIEKGTALRVADMYARVWDQLPPGGRKKYTANMARREGWVGPMHWDDIDTDPEPAETDLESAIDDVAIARALSGERVKLTRPERLEATLIAHGRQWSDTLTAERLHVHGKTIAAMRGELGLPAWPIEESISRSEAA